MFNELIRKRLIHEYTQEFVAEYIGVKRTTYSLIENMHVLPTASSMEKLAQLYGCSASELFPPKALADITKAYKPERQKQKSDVYNLTIRLPRSAHKILSKKNLKACGYNSLTEWGQTQIDRFYIELTKNNYIKGASVWSIE